MSGVVYKKENNSKDGINENNNDLSIILLILKLRDNLLTLIIVKIPTKNDIIFEMYTALTGFDPNNKNGVINHEYNGLQ